MAAMTRAEIKRHATAFAIYRQWVWADRDATPAEIAAEIGRSATTVRDVMDEHGWEYPRHWSNGDGPVSVDAFLSTSQHGKKRFAG